MTRLDFEKKPSEKLAHVKANFGVDSPYAKAMGMLVKITGDNPSAEELEEALDFIELEIEKNPQEFKPQS